MLTAFDHVNVRTSRLDEMIAWYGDVLGMKTGPRPDFSFPGAWLYLGDNAVVHLVGEKVERRAEDPKLEHVAFRAKGLAAFQDRLTAHGVAWQEGRLEDFGILQLNIHDPDGNHLHIDFDLAEAG